MMVREMSMMEMMIQLRDNALTNDSRCERDEERLIETMRDDVTDDVRDV